MNCIPFSKFHGLGNHFVIVDNRKECYDLANRDLVKSMYDVKIGIDADCLLEIRNCGHGAHKNCAFELINYRCDGTIDTLCGNGSRCAVKYACDLGIAQAEQEFTFCGSDGEHSGFYDLKAGLIHVRMRDVDTITQYDIDNYFVFAGSPSHVIHVEAVKDCDVTHLGEQICQRYPDGTNVMFVEMDRLSGEIEMRSYERGVKNETWACGTGAVGAALATNFRQNRFKCRTTFTIDLKVRLGALQVKATRVEDSKFTDVYLIGPVSHVFDGFYFSNMIVDNFKPEIT